MEEKFVANRYLSILIDSYQSYGFSFFFLKFPCILAITLGRNLVFRNKSTLGGFGRINLWRITINILTKRCRPINTALMVGFRFRLISLGSFGEREGRRSGMRVRERKRWRIEVKDASGCEIGDPHSRPTGKRRQIFAGEPSDCFL